MKQPFEEIWARGVTAPRIPNIDAELKFSSLCSSRSNSGKGLTVAQAVSRWLPTAAARVRVRAGMWGLCWTKRHWGRFSPSTSVFPANHHSTNFSIIIITRGWQNRPIGGRSAEWPQFGLHTPLYQLKKLINSGKIFHDRGTGGWVDLRSRLDAAGKETLSEPGGYRTPVNERLSQWVY
jgi:hypothetical protein